MTPYSLAFYVDVVTNGTLLGLSPSDSPDRVAEVLGADFGENDFGGGNMWRDYGLAEFYWSRARASDPWAGHHVTVQVHRLAHRDPAFLNKTLRARYGRFTPRLRFEKLRRLLERRGVPLVEVSGYSCNAPYYRTYWQPGAQVGITVVGTYGEYSTPDNLRVGDVYSITFPMTATEVERRGARSA
ncbi:hypothetical protein ACFYZ9_10090 [Streptomyces sp. NPDC001691]|uniref:hypothetical protein n=1 Tax=Streptomyces sp. NPDC001691 TaxID=3364600 RepID=UPI0036BD1F8B